jgi:predicted DsbA family dithiol-disulfide isomerase
VRPQCKDGPRNYAGSTMRIDVWSDVICPWCWLGNARLEKAIAAFAHADQLEVVRRSFELAPGTPKELDIPTDEMLAKKFGAGRAQIDAMHERLRALGRADGIDFRFERARTSNTFDAHQLVHLARAGGKEAAMVGRLFRANFHEGVRVGDRKELVRLATEVGLDPAEAEEALGDQRFASAVRDDEAEASARGISGVPFFLADREAGVSGAQSVDVLRRMLDEAWSRRGS